MMTLATYFGRQRQYFFGLVLLIFCGACYGHQTKLSSSALTLDSGEVVGEIELNLDDLQVALSQTFLDTGSSPLTQAIDSHSDAILDYVASKNVMYCGSKPQVPIRVGEFRFEDDHLLVKLSWQCDPSVTPTAYVVSLFHEIDTQSRHVVNISGDQTFVKLLTVKDRKVSFAVEDGNWIDLVIKFIISGIEHIAIGFDHIAFLIVVIVLGRNFWPLFKVVTAFTVAHSITLTLAVLNIINIPSEIIEPLIALSIVYVAVENFFVQDISRRYWVTFLFGLIHGFGFASVLRDFGLPQNDLVTALASFNIGVEIGQLLIVLSACLFWRSMMSMRFMESASSGVVRQRILSLWISGLVGLLGLGWFVERVFSLMV